MKHIPTILLTVFVVVATIYTAVAWVNWQIAFNVVVGFIVFLFVLRFAAACIARV
jgi:hypothetical protein